MDRARLIALLSLTLIAPAATGRIEPAETDFAYPPEVSLEAVRERIDAAPRAHPRLFATRAELTALRAARDAGPLRKALADAVVSQAEQMRDLPPLERIKTGRRLLGQSRRCLKRTVTLSTAYWLTGDERHARRCEHEMLAVARFRDWNPSHFLDVAEMTLALAVGYDWLHDTLGERSRDEIRSAIVHKGVELPFTTRHRGWVNATNNWGQVCHGGLTAGALAMLEDEPDLAARTVHQALHHVTRAMRAYAPRGSYPEGPGYWAYGTSYNVVLIAELESVLGTDFGLSKAPGFDETGQYPSLACGPSGLFFNYADGGAGRSPQPALFWFARRYRRPDWLLGEGERLRASLSRLRSADAAGSGGRLLPLALLWMGRPAELPPGAPIRMPLSWRSGGETPIAVHRSSWSDPNAVFVGLKGGSPSANHGQMDTGSFVLDADGARWALDLGAEGYHRIESRGMSLWNRAQDSDRWRIFRQSNEGHNTLVIDGRLQRAAGRGEIVWFSEDPRFAGSIVDMSTAYAGQATAVRRGVALLASREVLLQDELEGLKPGSRVRWGMITPAEPDAPGRRELALRQKGKRLSLRLLAPESARWRIVDTERPRHEWDSPNRATRMVAFEATAPASGRLTLAVLATPGSCERSRAGELELRALESWGR